MPPCSRTYLSILSLLYRLQRGEASAVHLPARLRYCEVYTRQRIKLPAYFSNSYINY